MERADRLPSGSALVRPRWDDRRPGRTGSADPGWLLGHSTGRRPETTHAIISRSRESMLSIIGCMWARIEILATTLLLLVMTPFAPGVTGSAPAQQTPSQ